MFIIPHYEKDSRFPKNVFVLGMVSLLMDISSEMIYPLIPVIGPALAFVLLGLFHNRLQPVFWVSIIPGLLSALPSSIIGGALWQNIGPQALFYYGAAMAMLSWILFVLLMFQKEK